MSRTPVVPSPEPNEASIWTKGLPAFVWAGTLIVVCLWVANRIGLFDVWTTVIGVDGVAHRLPESVATVDHPFHAARAEVLRRAILDGELLRWIANHQGGYPVEFYPLGVAWLEVGVWALSLGAWPMAYAHKVVVIAVFLLPGLAYWLLARRDGLSPVVAFAALVAHVAVPGDWWHGGYTETVRWGLITNVAASVALLFVLWGLVGYVHDGQRFAGAIAALSAAFAIASNPRSLIGLAVVGLAVLLACLRSSDGAGHRPSTVVRRLALVSLLTAGLAAPELLSLIRFSDLYFFVRYEAYDDLRELFTSSIDAVSPPVALLAVVGVVVGLAIPRRPAVRAAAIAFVLYLGVTALLATGPQDLSIIEQLEAPRLMPFQRLLAIYLAAVALDAILRAVLPKLPVLAESLVAGAALLLLVAYVNPIGPIHAEREGLFPVLSTATPEQADFLAAVTAADAAAPPGQAMLVLGTTLSWNYQWHQQLWAPYETDRPLFYDNWLWYWHTDHVGPYDYRTGHAYPASRAPETLDRAYLDQHGIAAIVVTGDALKEQADGRPYLELVRTGVFDVFLVADPAPIVVFPGGASQTVRVDNQEIVATGESQGGQIMIARNWFPRWRATVNGDSVEVTRTEDGYMSVPAPVGDVTLELNYVVDGWDWLARLLVVAGMVGVVWLGWPKRRWPRLQRPSATA